MKSYDPGKSFRQQDLWGNVLKIKFVVLFNTKRGKEPVETPQKHTEEESLKTASLPVLGNVIKSVTY